MKELKKKKAVQSFLKCDVGEFSWWGEFSVSLWLHSHGGFVPGRTQNGSDPWFKFPIRQ